MKKLISHISLFVFLVYFLTTVLFPISAHPGKTDSSGGHRDSSTGEYHYHHGYSAHDHYDMDGDGTLDCPYNFKDKTSHKSSGYSSNKSESSSGVITNSTSSTTIQNKATYKVDEKVKVPSIIIWILFSLIVAIITLFSIIKRKEKEINKANREHQIFIENQDKEFKNGLADFIADIQENVGPFYLYTICKAPEGDYIDKDGLPCSQDATENNWGERYTFYTSSPKYGYSLKYHKHSCRYANHDFPVNAYIINKNPSRFTRCHCCWSYSPDTSWVGKYLKHTQFLENHGIAKLVPYKEVINSAEDLTTKEMIESYAIQLGVSIGTASKLLQYEIESGKRPSPNSNIVRNQGSD